MKRLFLYACLAVLVSCSGTSPRTESLLTRWQFRQSTSEDWSDVTVPHDWAIYGPFDRNNDLQRVAVVQNFESTATDKTGRSGGLPYMGEGYYRTEFVLDRVDDRCITLLFDGAMSEARVRLNGTEICYWPYGYNSFWTDATAQAVVGDNLLEVDLRNLPFSSRWYPGAGLYRNVHLIVTDAVHVPVWGTCFTTPEVSASRATVHARIDSAGKADSVEFETEIYGPDGLLAGKASGAEFDLTVEHPHLWSPETPSLYRAVTKLYRDNECIDRYETRFGIRSIEIRPDDGFYLNGVKRKFKGVCNHHDLGALGAAVNRAALKRQLTLLKDMGCDAIRTTHNMPAPELVELCDRMGFMMMIEPFDEWETAKCENGYHRFFDEWAERDMVNMIRNYRNSPSVVMWSIGNEVPTQWLPEGKRVAEYLQNICHREDPTRPVTCGMDQVDAVLDNGFAAVLDVPGFNYRAHRYAEGYERLPQKVLLGTETASTVSSRGVYKRPFELRAGATYDDHQCSSYDTECCWWSNIPEEDFANADDYHWTLGQFVWTGFDYLGEPSPYDTDAWPNHSSMFGMIDLATIPKDRYYLYRSQWNTSSPTLHVLPHWSWLGHEGEPIPVVVYTSYPEVELFLNDRSCGRRAKNDNSLIERYRLVWDGIPFEAGELRAVAYDSAGKRVDNAVVRTAGEPYALHLEADRSTIVADGLDLAYITITAVDRNGNHVPTDSRMVSFEVSGEGSFRASANGDPTCLLPFHEPQMRLFGGKLCAIVQSTDRRGVIRFKAMAEGLQSSTTVIGTK